jgi:hypothetical protein
LIVVETEREVVIPGVGPVVGKADLLQSYDQRISLVCAHRSGLNGISPISGLEGVVGGRGVTEVGSRHLV